MRRAGTIVASLLLGLAFACGARAPLTEPAVVATTARDAGAIALADGGAVPVVVADGATDASAGASLLDVRTPTRRRPFDAKGARRFEPSPDSKHLLGITATEVHVWRTATMELVQSIATP